MKTPRFEGPFKWSALRQQLLSLREDVQSIRKLAGRNVTVDERPGKGTVINVTRERPGAAGECPPCDDGVHHIIDISGLELNVETCIAFVNGVVFHTISDINQTGYEIYAHGCDAGSQPDGGTVWYDDGFAAVIKYDRYVATDCSGSPFSTNTPFPWEIFVGCFSGVWYCFIGSDGVIFFYGTGTSNVLTNLSTWSTFNAIHLDNPLTNWWFGGAGDYTGIGKNGTVTIHIP